MRLLVTGASGFIGSHLIDRCRSRGDDVVGTFATGSREVGEGEIEADLLDPPALAAAVTAVDPQVIVHLGGLSHVGLSWKRIGDYFQVNVLGTENLLSAAGDRRVIFASSAEVYGKVPENEQPIVEDRVPAPRSPYAMSKAAAERLCLHRNAVVVRAFNVVGAGQATDFVLPSFAGQLAQIEAGERSTLKVGNLEARRDFIHVDDAVDALLTVAAKGEPAAIYNIGSGQARSIRRLLDLLLEVSAVDARPEVDPDRFRPVDIPLLSAATVRLRSLGWEPRRSLRQAVEEVWGQARASVGVEETRR